MVKYKITWSETNYMESTVEADSEDEAWEKFYRRDEEVDENTTVSGSESHSDPKFEKVED